MVNFNEALHQYTNNEGVVYESVTQVLEHYIPKFDKEFWMYYKVLQDKLGFPDDEFGKKAYSKYLIQAFGFNFKQKSLEILKEISFNLGFGEELDMEYKEAEWKKKNKDSLIRGTAFHESMEKKNLIQESKKMECGNTIHYYSYNKGLENTEFGRNRIEGIPELRLYNHRYRIAGTTDDPVFYPNKKVKINDFKGFALDTPIATKEGWKEIGDIKIGDTIFDGEGNLTKVEHVSEIHHNPCFKIQFDTNDELVCDHEHKWVISTWNKDKSHTDKEMTTQEIFDYYATGTKLRLKIKCTSLQLPDIELPIDPYVLGSWIGDGNRNCGAITNLNPKTWEEIEKRGYHVGDDISHKDRAETRTVFGLYKQLKDLDLLKNKSIPLIYLRASHKQRLDLLRGFMDSDGHFHRGRKRCLMNTTKKWQADFLIQLTSSLGMKPILLPYKGKGFGKTNIQMYCVCFSPKENPFLSRNEDYLEVMAGVNSAKSEYRNIKHIQKIDTVPTKCLAVESINHTYLAGYSLIKTHNTNKEIKLKNAWGKMLYPLHKLDDCNFSHYNIQLSLYGWMLEQFGYEVVGLSIEHYLFNEEGKAIGSIPYPMKYLKKEVEALLEHYEFNHQRILHV